MARNLGVTRLKRKDRRNKAKAANRIKRIKQLSRRPVIKKLEATPEVTVAQVEVTVAQEEE